MIPALPASASRAELARLLATGYLRLLARRLAEPPIEGLDAPADVEAPCPVPMNKRPPAEARP